ncbi:MAG: hypothetical protein IJ361_02920 [Spirochaetaceae bacterium]|nr:hypothetical protein [Spirochaetaceae bacterium]
MAKIYAEFGIEIFDESLLEECYNIMKILGEVEIKETRRKTYLIEYHSKTLEVKEIEFISNEIYEKINLIKDKIKCFINLFSEKLYADICFVKLSDEKNVSIKINKNLISIANELNLEINFDGF